MIVQGSMTDIPYLVFTFKYNWTKRLYTNSFDDKVYINTWLVKSRDAIL